MDALAHTPTHYIVSQSPDSTWIAVEMVPFLYWTTTTGALYYPGALKGRGMTPNDAIAELALKMAVLRETLGLKEEDNHRDRG